MKPYQKRLLLLLLLNMVSLALTESERREKGDRCNLKVIVVNTRNSISHRVAQNGQGKSPSGLRKMTDSTSNYITFT